MKMIPVLMLVLFGCVDSDAPASVPPPPDWSVFENCGRPPQPPHWSFAPAPGDPSSVIMSAKVMEAHEAWAIAIYDWANCADTSQ